MLKFFRTIRKKLIEQDNVRKKLIEQNKVRTYFLYSIDEILLVVLGNNCPVRDYLSVETITPTAKHCAVRYNI